MTTQEILVWAAGGREPQVPDYDEESLLAAVTAHHLEIRLERRLAADRPSWASPTLTERVTATADEIRSLSRRQLAALAEALAGAAGPARPLMAKGLAWKLLTGREYMLKRSIDLDLFSRDPAGLLDCLVGLGYAVDPKDSPEPFGRIVAHEFAKLSRDGIYVDLHRSFPAWRYPGAVATPAVTSPAANPGSWTCVGSVVPGQLSTEGLFAEAVERPGPGGTAVVVTGPEMTAVLSSCHVFANYLTEFPAPCATVRLGELANIAELTAAGDFDWARFARLATVHGASDAVAYALALTGRWLGARRAPPAGARRAGDPLPPRSLWFARGEGTFLVSTGAVESPEDVLVRSTTTADLVRHLGGVPVPVTADGEGGWHTTLPAVAGVPLGRELVHRTGSETFGLRLALHPSSDGLGFVIETPDPRGAQVDVLFYFGEAILECVEHTGGERYVYDRTVEQRVDPARLAFRREPATDSARARYAVTIPWTRIPDPATAELPMLLGVRRWHGAGSYPLAGTLVPLLLALRR